jgi:hypothetical protein
MKRQSSNDKLPIPKSDATKPEGRSMLSRIVMGVLGGLMGIAALGVVVWMVAMGILIHEVTKTPEPREAQGEKLKEVAPLTDVAAEQRQITLGTPEPGTQGPMASTPSPADRVAGMAQVIPPAEMADPSNPPQWTMPLAEPGEPQPPDPINPPPIEVDPDRGRSHDQ